MSGASYRLWSPDLEETEDNAEVIQARNCEDAVRTWAARYDDDCFNEIARGKVFRVNVRGPEGLMGTYEARGRMVPEYSVALLPQEGPR